jgi:hypothetical protein
MNLETTEIIQHAKASEENMRVALAVGLAFDELRKELIRDFAGAFEKKLREEDWAKDGIIDNHWHKDQRISYRENHWPDKVFVSFSVESGKCISGVVAPRDENAKKQDKFAGEQTWECIKQHFSGTHWDKVGNWWTSYHEVPKYGNFKSLDTLMAIYKKDEMISTLLKEFEQLTEKVNELYRPQQ